MTTAEKKKPILPKAWGFVLALVGLVSGIMTIAAWFTASHYATEATLKETEGRIIAAQKEGGEQLLLSLIGELEARGVDAEAEKTLLQQGRLDEVVSGLANRVEPTTSQGAQEAISPSTDNVRFEDLTMEVGRVYELTPQRIPLTITGIRRLEGCYRDENSSGACIGPGSYNRLRENSDCEFSLISTSTESETKQTHGSAEVRIRCGYIQPQN